MHWFDTELDDAEFERMQDAYAAHAVNLAVRAPHLKPLLDLNLHDGLVRHWSAEQGSIRWEMTLGDLQRGYDSTTILYLDADVVGGAAAVATLRLMDEDTELLFDEVEQLGPERFLHRISVWPEGELLIEFTSAWVTREPRATRG